MPLDKQPLLNMKGNMGKVIKFKQRDNVTCCSCSKESREDNGKPLWDLTLPFDGNCSLYMVVYSSGWSKNETIQANRVNGEEKITFQKTTYLCPKCNHHSVD